MGHKLKSKSHELLRYTLVRSADSERGGRQKAKLSMLKTISVNPISTVASKRCFESSTAVFSLFALCKREKADFGRLIHVTWRVEGWMPISEVST